jgi:hypothetical protein
MATTPVKLALAMATDPGTVATLKCPGKGYPALWGGGPVSYACPRCRAVLCRGVDPARVCHLVFQCECGALSRVTPPVDV